MADQMRFDFSELDALSNDLIDGIDRAMDAAVAVTKRGAQNIKTDAVDLIRGQLSPPGLTHLPHYPRAIDYELDEGGLSVTAEIGPDSAKRQGGRGSGVEFGSVNARPMPHMFPALDEEEPRYLEQLARRVGDVIL